MSSLWSHSHETNREAAEQSSDVHSLEHPSNLISLLAAVGNDLPLVDSSNLKFDKKIGKGSSFEVRRATLSSSEDQISTSEHYVAVKLIIVAGKAPSQLRRQYDSVIRELRVLTHPSLRDHDNIIHLIGYGWTNDVYGMRPYLVVDYSIDGTLIQYLNRIKPRMKLDLAELRELALDVALGLKALHNSKIIHGDIKTQNILAYNASGQGPRRSLIAKLADFGSSIFELDESQLVTYGGTALYNAPEQEGRGRYKIEKAFKLEHFYAADVYSFGITLWEIMNHGRAYIEIDWRMSGESDTQFLDRVCIDEEDGLLRRAVEFCERLFEGTNQNSVKMAILQTFNLTLRDLASRRSDMLRIIEVLAQGTEIQRPVLSYPLPRTHAVKPSIAGEPGVNNYLLRDLNEVMSTRIASEANSLVMAKTSKDMFAHVPDSATSSSERSVSTIVKPPPARPSQFRPSSLDIFQMSMTELCWPIRVEIFKNLQQEGQPKPFMAPGAQLKCWEACLQLAMCYHTGFGVPPDNKTMLRFLTLSLPGNATTKAIYRRVVSALGHGENKEAVDFGFQTEIDRAIEESATGENYFATRIRTYQQYATKKSSLWMNQSPRVNRLALADVVRSGIPSLTAHALRKWKFDDKEISAALCLACKRGLFNVAMQICRYCEKFILEEEGPNPFHWLIMFEDQEAEKLARVLVYGSSENQDGPCREYINRMCTARDGVLYFPEHCLQLFGSPLHWAVRTRNLKLVQLLVQLGADVNVRWSDHQRLHDKAPLSGLKNISALDVAVMFHLPEIIQTLLDSGASTHYQASHYLDRGYLASRFIGWECIPLSRYIVHGEGYRDALKEVLRILNSDGRDLHERVSGGYDSLMAALSNCCERYVVEELLAAGADPTRLHNGSNAALSITRSAHIRPYDVANLALVVPRVLDINEPDSTGNNAIHTVAILEAPGMAETISNSPNFKVDMKNAHDMTALHLAAIFGATETLSILIRKQANVECENKVGSTPLELAAIFGQTGAADVLLDAGAEVRFSPGNYTVLHAAVYGKKFPDATLRHLLATHCKLRSKAIIHTTDSFGWTALHKAAHFGDYNAVDALLSYGADPTLGDGHGITPLKLVVKTLDEVQSSGLHHLEHKRILDKGPEAVRAYKTYLQETKRILEDANVHNDSP